MSAVSSWRLHHQYLRALPGSTHVVVVQVYWSRRQVQHEAHSSDIAALGHLEQCDTLSLGQHVLLEQQLIQTDIAFERME